MVRLKLPRGRVRLIAQWLPALLISGAVIGTFHSQIYANRAPSRSELATFINGGGQVRSGSISQNGYSQVYYVYEGNVFYLTEGPENRKNVSASGKFIAWEKEINGRGQIAVYDLLTGASRLVTNSGVNQFPKVDEFGNVAWERWDGEVYQVTYYSYQENKIYGVSDTPRGGIRPSVLGNRVSYATQQADFTWSVTEVDVATGERFLIASGKDATQAWPQYKSQTELTTQLSQFIKVVEPLIQL